jgi:fibronectin-binding autotransporter adhesin
MSTVRSFAGINKYYPCDAWFGCWRDVLTLLTLMCPGGCPPFRRRLGLPSMRGNTPPLSLAAIGLLLLAASSHAADFTWDGGGANDNWLTADNWAGDIAPTNGDALIFNSIARQNNNNNYGAITNAALTFANGGWTLNGNQIKLSGPVTNRAGTNVMNLPVVMNGSRIMNVAAESQLTVNGVISGNTFGLTKTGAGTLVLNANNTFSGVVTINEGTVSLPTLANAGSPSPLGAAAGASHILNGGTLEITRASAGAMIVNPKFSIGTNGGTVCVTNPLVDVRGDIANGWDSGGNVFIKTGHGTLRFDHPELLTGTNIVREGPLYLYGSGWFGGNTNIPLFVESGGSVAMRAVSATELSTMGAKPVVAVGMGDLVKAGPGSTNGALYCTGGAYAPIQTNAFRYVTLTGDTAIGNIGGASWDIRGNPDGYLMTGGNAYTLYKTANINSTDMTNWVGLANIIVDPALADINVQAGTLRMEGTTTGLGNPTNILTVVSNAAFSMLATTNRLNKRIVLLDFAVLRSDGGNNTIVGPVSMSGDFGAGPIFDIADTLNLAGVVSGVGNLTKTGPGTLNLAATNTYTGTITVNAGRLVMSSVQTGAGAITINDDATLGVVVSGANQLHPTSLTLGNAGPTTNEFSGVASATMAPIRAASLVVNGTTIVNVLGGTLLAGQTYPLIHFDDISGKGEFVLGTLPAGVTAKVITNGGNTIALSVITAPGNTMPELIMHTVSGGELILSWPADRIGWRLMEQTNNLVFGVSANTDDWSPVAGSELTNLVSRPIDMAKPAELYRLMHP